MKLMAKGKIHHSVKNKLWIKPEIEYDTWLNLKNYGRAHNLDFPATVDLAASILLDPKANEIANADRVDVTEIFHEAIDLLHKRRCAFKDNPHTVEAVTWGTNE